MLIIFFLGPLFPYSFPLSVNGILFKLARDPVINKNDLRGPPRYLYGDDAPNVELASKAAGHELRSASYCFSVLETLAKKEGR